MESVRYALVYCRTLLEIPMQPHRYAPKQNSYASKAQRCLTTPQVPSAPASEHPAWASTHQKTVVVLGLFVASSFGFGVSGVLRSSGLFGRFDETGTIVPAIHILEHGSNHFARSILKI